MTLHIAEFGGAGLNPSALVASQTVAVSGTSAQSAALNAVTQLVRLLAEEDCQIAVGLDPDAGAGAVIALVANAALELPVTPGYKIAVIARSSGAGGTVEADNTTATEAASGPYHQTTLTLTDAEVTLTDDAGNGQYGGLLLYTFPEGLVKSLGVAVNGTLTGDVSYIATFDGSVSVGTTAVSDATFGGADEDLLADGAFTQAVDSVAAVNRVGGSAAAESDGTTTAVPVYLNFVITDDAAHATGTGLFNGTVTLTWLYLGDD